MSAISFPTYSKLSPDDRLNLLAQEGVLKKEECDLLRSGDSLPLDTADHMIEDVVGRFSLPLGLVTDLVVNEKEYLVPMVAEEPSLVSACSRGAAIAKETGGFIASYTGSVMIAQIELVDVPNPEEAKLKILSAKKEIMHMADEKDPVLKQHGFGAEDVEVRIIKAAFGTLVVVHLLVDVGDAIGANLLNGMAETVSPLLEKLSGGKAAMRILSNMADRRIAKASCVFPKGLLGGEEVVDKIVQAYAFADADPYRAITNNKGIMNGISPVVLATGNDTRAVECAAHVYACRSGQCRPLAIYEKTRAGDLQGTITMPMPVALVGGTTRLHPIARLLIHLMDVKSAGELAQVLVSMGMCLNMIAMRSLVTGGMQKAHNINHARAVAATAGANGLILEEIVERMLKEEKVSVEYAKELLNKKSIF